MLLMDLEFPSGYFHLIFIATIQLGTSLSLHIRRSNADFATIESRFRRSAKGGVRYG